MESEGYRWLVLQEGFSGLLMRCLELSLRCELGVAERLGSTSQRKCRMFLLAEMSMQLAACI